jgi:hypothetical protein
MGGIAASLPLIHCDGGLFAELGRALPAMLYRYMRDRAR